MWRKRHLCEDAPMGQFLEGWGSWWKPGARARIGSLSELPRSPPQRYFDFEFEASSI